MKVVLACYKVLLKCSCRWQKCPISIIFVVKIWGGSLLFYFTFYCIFPLPFIPLRPPTPQECFEISMIYSHFALEDLAWSPPAPNGSSTCLFKNKSIQTFNCPQTSFRESTCALCAAARPCPWACPGLPGSQPASWPCVQTEAVCRYYQPDITVPTISPKSGDLRTAFETESEKTWTSNFSECNYEFCK